MSRKLPIDVMISSTSRDLPLHRDRAIKVVQRRGFFPQVMENLPASERDAITDSLRLVDEAEIYVGIFGRRYGYIPDDADRNPKRISITEMEYRRALERGIPVICFIMTEKHLVPADQKSARAFFETSDEGQQKLDKLVAVIKGERVVNFFSSHDELGLQLLAALYDEETTAKAIDKLPPDMREVVKKMQAEPAQPSTSKRDAIPAPPEFYTRPAYAGGMGFVGRADELALLDAWATNDAKPLLVVDAIGGQGKSALTWHWTNNNLGQFDGVVWWSFYTQGTTMSDFLRHTLAYVSERPLDDVPRADHEARTELLTHLQNGRYLLVLDGLERVLTAYHRLDAAAIRDDEVESDKRAATNPKDTETLHQLLTCGPSKVLVSTRLLPRAWENRFGMPHPHVEQVKLEGLSPADTLALAEAAQIHVEDEQRVTGFLYRFGYHPLVVGAILGLIGGPRNRKYRRSFDAWLDDNQQTFSLHNLDLRQRQTHIVGYTISGLTPDARELLARLALFRDAVPYDAIPALGVSDDDAVIGELLLELESSGLLMYDPATDEHDLHPVVRGYSQDLLTGENRRAAFSRAYDYFEAQPEEDYDAVTTVEELTRSIEVVRALQGARRLQEAIDVYYDTISRHLFYNLGAYDLMRTLLTPFFPDGDLKQPSALESARDRSWVTNEMAVALQSAGDPLAAVPLYLAATKYDLETQNSGDIAAGLRNTANAMRDGGRPAPARRLYEYSLRAALATDEYENDARLNVMIGAVSRGDWAAALEQYYTDESYSSNFAFLRYRAEMAAARDEADAPDFLRRALDLNRQARQVRWIMELHYNRALYALGKGDPTPARPHAEEAVNLARRTNDRRLGATLAALAHVRAMQADFDVARDLIGQADRAVCAPTYQADRELGAAWVHHLAGERDLAVERALKAYELAWADGESDHLDHTPGYTFWWALQRSKALLAELGVEPPELPMFDPNDPHPLGIEGYETLEDEIIAFIEKLEAKKAARHAADRDDD